MKALSLAAAAVVVVGGTAWWVGTGVQVVRATDEWQVTACPGMGPSLAGARRVLAVVIWPLNSMINTQVAIGVRFGWRPYVCDELPPDGTGRLTRPDGTAAVIGRQSNQE